MGHRELRPVPLDWEHPRDERGHYVPLFSRAALRWHRKFYGEHPEYDDWEYDPAAYMPEMAEGTPYGWQLYEVTTEGTPVSPVFATLEELAAWCETGATVFADSTWTREQWLASFRNDSLDADSLAYGTPGRGLHPGNPLGG